MGLALHNYHDTFNTLPMCAFDNFAGADVGTNDGNWSWGAMILPQLEQAPLFQKLNVGNRGVNQVLQDTSANGRVLLRDPAAGVSLPQRHRSGTE